MNPPLFAELWTALQQFVERLRFADVLDVALIALLLYGVMRWLREGATRTVLVIVGLLAALVVMARVLDMYLTLLVLDTLLTVAAVVLVVAFQPEIRRFLERLAAGELFRSHAPELDVAPAIDTIIAATTRMARERIGALIVLRGREPWSHFVDGGIALGGRVSEPMLLSIFDAGSPGHDGAVLVEGDRIVCFAAHLPLSKNHAEVGRRGTRHAAALGLSERCDAMVVVVSEERGEISIAEAGRLKTLGASSELKDRLDSFWQKKHTPGDPLTRSRGPREAGFIAASIALAALFWAIFAYQSDVVYRTFDVPVEFRNTPATLAMSGNTATDVSLTLAGSPQAFRRLQPTELLVVVDLGEAQAGPNVVTAAEWEIDLPSGLSLYTAEPPALGVRLMPRPQEP